MLDVETALVALSLEAVATLVFAAGFLLGCPLTCCCLRRREHAEPESQVNLNSRCRRSYQFQKALSNAQRCIFQ